MLLVLPAHAHIGSPDTFVQAEIGPYAVLLAAHPPATTPGALELDLRFAPDDRITRITAALDDATPTTVPLVLDGTSSISLWSPTASAETLHLTVQGIRGSATYSINLPASKGQSSPPKRFGSIETRRGEITVLFIAFAVVLALVFSRHRRKLLFATALILALLIVFAVLAHHRASTTRLTASLTGDQLDFTLTSPAESFADLLPDHGKLIHLFLIREPNKDVFLHLHPVQLSPGHFRTNLPAMPPGTYTLFADLYHADGTPETAALRLTLPGQSHSALTDPDDTTAVLPPIAHSPATSSLVSGEQQLHTFPLHDNYTLTLLAPSHLAPLHANLFTVTLLDPTGKPPQDMALYLAMSAHAVILRADDQVFAHIHPGGTLPMLMPANMTMAMPAVGNPAANTATIPYGFPSVGLYRVFVQMKQGHTVETAAFDLTVN
jgi:hypothetical protein